LIFLWAWGIILLAKSRKKGGAMYRKMHWDWVDWKEVRAIMRGKRSLIQQEIEVFLAEHPEFGAIYLFELEPYAYLRVQFYLHPRDKRRAEVFGPPHRIRDLRDKELNVLADFGAQLMKWDETIRVRRISWGGEKGIVTYSIGPKNLPALS